MVLEETWEQEETTLTLEDQEPFWSNIFSSESEVDERPVPKVQVDWSIVDPVTREEVTKAVADSEESAPGPDGITLREVMTISPVLLASYFNIWLLLGEMPKQFSDGETILIPKGGDLTDPANFRPITMASRVTRVFHKILSCRLTVKVPLDPRQKAFVPVDGCADNILITSSGGPSGRENRCAWPS